MLYFVTGNKEKIFHARLKLDPEGITFTPKDLPLKEIQSESIKEIAIDKAEQAYKLLQKPLIVKDDGWFIESLNGFPGPFMKYINSWLTVKDIQHLMKDKKNRTILFHEVIIYIDNTQTKQFSNKISGELLDEPRGNNLPFSELSTFRKDRKSMAECINEGIDPFDEHKIWNDFADWYKTIS